MAEKLYEGMFLLDSGRFAVAPQAAVDEVLGILGKAGATVVAHRPWLEGKLAYSIEGHAKGLYYLAFFRMEGRGVTQVARACKLSELVLRHMVINHPPVLFDAMVNALSGHEVVSLDSQPIAEATVDEVEESEDSDFLAETDEATERDASEP